MKNKICVITTCCKEKDLSASLLPAIERYKSQRISEVFQISKEKGLPMLIFSGKYGLLESEDPVPYYDKKLEMEDLTIILPLLKEDFLKFQIEKIQFYGNGVNAEGWAPYYKAIELVCIDLGIEVQYFLSIF